MISCSKLVCNFNHVLFLSQIEKNVTDKIGNFNETSKL